jgi:hypothetical protein
MVIVFLKRFPAGVHPIALTDLGLKNYRPKPGVKDNARETYHVYELL